MLTIVVAVVVLAHGVGHILFLGPALGLADWAGQTSHSWIVTPIVGDTLARGLAGLIWTTAIALFCAGVGGFLAGQDWWRQAAVVASMMSIVGIVAFWDGISTGSAVFALVVDAVILVVILVERWPAAETSGV